MHLNIEGLEAAVEAVVDRRLDARLSSLALEDEWLDSSAAAKYLGVSRQRIHDLTSQGILPRVGEPGERLFFRRSTLDAYREGRAS
jgi:hypothetical protein